MRPDTSSQSSSSYDQEAYALDARAVEVVERVRRKLNGRDFGGNEMPPLKVEEQVVKLIQQARSTEALCQLYLGCAIFPKVTARTKLVHC